MEKSIYIENESLVLDEDTSDTEEDLSPTKNPLYISKKHIIEDGETININISNAYKYFKNVNILCPISNVEKFYLNEEVSDKDISHIKNNMIIHTIKGLSILTSKFFMNNAKIFSNKQIKQFRNIGQEFEKNNLVVTILTINYFNLKSFIEMFDKNKSIEDLHKIIIMSEYFKLDKNHYKVMNELSKLLTNLEGAKHWFSFYNTNYNYDYIIKHRTIQEFNKTNTNVNNYENIIIPMNKKFSISNLEHNGKKVFRVTPEVNFSIEETNILFRYFMTDNNLSSLNKTMIYSFLLNPRLCHLIVNNYSILNSIKETYKDDVVFCQKFKKCIGYAWIRLYNDELIKEIYITKNDNIVIDINNASLLPSYSIESTQLKLNPYFPLLVSDKVLNTKNNILSLQATKEMNICNINQFQRQMNIFITGKPYINIFENIDLVSRNVVICGSILPACAILNHPALMKFDNNVLPHNEDEERIDALLRRFFAEYYSKSDIDIMISDCTHFEFCKIANDIFNDLLLNFCRFFRDAEPQLFKLKKVKSIGLFITTDYLEENDFTIDMIEKLKKFINTNDNENIYNMVKECISNDYNNIIKDEYDLLSEEDKKYCDNFMEDFKLELKELKDNEIIVEFNTKIVDKLFTSTNQKSKLYINTKYYITSPFINHDIEIFRNKNKDPFSLISKFHLNCVRGYYDGISVKLLPSCVSALKTLVNMDFKYFAGKRNPYQIINKYRMRGIGTILNKKEINAYKEYISSSKWNKLYKSCNNKQCTSCNKITGFMNLDNSLFSPRKYLNEDFTNDKIAIFDLKYNSLNSKLKAGPVFSEDLIISEKGNVIKPIGLI
tara:strand:- start:136 stop:2637 length:2502 start_codon:yes stop_codon:yes gene_type:complete